MGRKTRRTGAVVGILSAAVLGLAGLTFVDDGGPSEDVALGSYRGGYYGPIGASYGANAGPRGGCEYNLFRSSSEFDDGTKWPSTGVTVTTGFSGPFGYKIASEFLSLGGSRVGYLQGSGTDWELDDDTLIFSVYLKNGDTTVQKTHLGVRDRTGAVTYNAHVQWNMEVPTWDEIGSDDYVTLSIEDVGEYWYRFTVVYDSQAAGTQGNAFDGRIRPSTVGGRTIYVAAAQFEAGDGITEARVYCPTPPGVDDGAAANTYPTITSIGVACAPTNQFINAATDINCFFRYRWQIQATNKTPTTAWSPWTTVANTTFQQIESEFPVANFYFTAEVEVRSAENVPALSNPEFDSFQWDSGGVCP